MIANYVIQLLRLLLIGLLLLPTACSSLTQTPTASTPSPSDQASVVPGAQTPPAIDQLPRLKGTATVVLRVKGQPITIQMDGTDAPVTAGNFVDLVNRGVYDRTTFHRVVSQPEPFVVQGGDPNSKNPDVPAEDLGTGNFIDPATSQPRFIPLEITPEGADQPVYSEKLNAPGGKRPPKLKHERGAVAMARAMLPDSASAQFYIALTALPSLDGDYAVFGKVTNGMTVVDQIQQGDRIESAKVTQGSENLTEAGNQASPAPQPSQ